MLAGESPFQQSFRAYPVDEKSFSKMIEVGIVKQSSRYFD